MQDRYRSLCREVESATIALGDANRSAEKALERVVGTQGTLQTMKPTPVIDGVELPQTIVFTGTPET